MLTMGDFTVRTYGTGYSVFDKSGARVGGIHDRHGALEKAEALARAARMKLRPCLRCNDRFMSEGPHNRLCDPCRRRAGDAGGDYRLSL